MENEGSAAMKHVCSGCMMVGIAAFQGHGYHFRSLKEVLSRKVEQRPSQEGSKSSCTHTSNKLIYHEPGMSQLWAWWPIGASAKAEDSQPLASWGQMNSVRQDAP